MIASVQIANAARAFPDAVPLSSGGSEASTPASFQSVLHQYHSPAEQDNEESSTPQNGQHSRQESSPAWTPAGEPQNAATASKADPKSALATAQDQGTDTTATSGAGGASTSANFRVMLDRFRSTRPGFEASDAPVSSQQKTTDLTQTVAAPLLATHTVEPRFTLPLAASITLRQDRTVSQMSSEGSGAFIPANFRSMFHQYHSLHEHDSEEDDAQSSSQQDPKDSAPARTAAAPVQDAALAPKADPKAALPPAQEQAGDTTAPPVGSLAFAVSLSPTSSAASGASTYVKFPSALHNYHSSRAGDSEEDDTQSGSPQNQNSDPTRTLAAPLPVTQAVEPPRLILPLTASITVRQDGTASQSNSTAPQAVMLETETDQAMAVPPPRAQADETATVSAGLVAFAARLSPNAETEAPASNALRGAEQASFPNATQTVTKQVATGTSEVAEAHSGAGGDPSSRENAGDLFAKPDALPVQTPAAVPDHTIAPVHNDVVHDAGNNVTKNPPAVPVPPLARMDRIIEPPAAQTSTNHDITVRIPDATAQGTAVRFVERGSEVHVSVRTGDAEMAQALRGGLNDLVNRLQDGGIRTEVWRPGSDSSSSQDDPHHPFADRDGSNGNSSSSGSHSEQESSQQNKPRWVEELEGSIGNENIKETSQILWQV